MDKFNLLQTKATALFSVARGSDISPPELANAGFMMREGRFYPVEDIEVIQQRLSHDFMVWDESTPFVNTLRFQRRSH